MINGDTSKLFSENEIDQIFKMLTKERIIQFNLGEMNYVKKFFKCRKLGKKKTKEVINNLKNFKNNQDLINTLAQIIIQNEEQNEKAFSRSTIVGILLDIYFVIDRSLSSGWDKKLLKIFLKQVNKNRRKTNLKPLEQKKIIELFFSYASKKYVPKTKFTRDQVLTLKGKIQDPAQLGNSILKLMKQSRVKGLSRSDILFIFDTLQMETRKVFSPNEVNIILKPISSQNKISQTKVKKILKIISNDSVDQQLQDKESITETTNPNSKPFVLLNNSNLLDGSDFLNRSNLPNVLDDQGQSNQQNKPLVNQEINDLLNNFIIEDRKEDRKKEEDEETEYEEDENQNDIIQPFINDNLNEKQKNQQNPPLIDQEIDDVLNNIPANNIIVDERKDEQKRKEQKEVNNRNRDEQMELLRGIDWSKNNAFDRWKDLVENKLVDEKLLLEKIGELSNMLNFEISYGEIRDISKQLKLVRDVIKRMVEKGYSSTENKIFYIRTTKSLLENIKKNVQKNSYLEIFNEIDLVFYLFKLEDKIPFINSIEAEETFLFPLIADLKWEGEFQDQFEDLARSITIDGFYKIIERLKEIKNLERNPVEKFNVLLDLATILYKRGFFFQEYRDPLKDVFMDFLQINSDNLTSQQLRGVIDKTKGFFSQFDFKDTKSILSDFEEFLQKQDEQKTKKAEKEEKKKKEQEEEDDEDEDEEDDDEDEEEDDDNEKEYEDEDQYDILQPIINDNLNPKQNSSIQSGQMVIKRAKITQPPNSNKISERPKIFTKTLPKQRPPMDISDDVVDYIQKFFEKGDGDFEEDDRDFEEKVIDLLKDIKTAFQIEQFTIRQLMDILAESQTLQFYYNDEYHEKEAFVNILNDAKKQQIIDIHLEYINIIVEYVIVRTKYKYLLEVEDSPLKLKLFKSDTQDRIRKLKKAVDKETYLLETFKEKHLKDFVGRIHQLFGEEAFIAKYKAGFYDLLSALYFLYYSDLKKGLNYWNNRTINEILSKIEEPTGPFTDKDSALVTNRKSELIWKFYFYINKYDQPATTIDPSFIQSLRTTPALSINQLSNKIIDELLLEKNKGYSRTNLLFILRSLSDLKEADIQTIIQNVLKSKVEENIKKGYTNLEPSQFIKLLVLLVTDKNPLEFLILDSSSFTKPTIQQSQKNKEDLNKNAQINNNNNNQQQMSKSTAIIPVPSLKNTLQPTSTQTIQQSSAFAQPTQPTLLSNQQIYKKILPKSRPKTVISQQIIDYINKNPNLIAIDCVLLIKIKNNYKITLTPQELIDILIEVKHIQFRLYAKLEKKDLVTILNDAKKEKVVDIHPEQIDIIADNVIIATKYKYFINYGLGELDEKQYSVPKTNEENQKLQNIILGDIAKIVCEDFSNNQIFSEKKDIKINDLLAYLHYIYFKIQDKNVIVWTDSLVERMFDTIIDYQGSSDRIQDFISKRRSELIRKFYFYINRYDQPVTTIDPSFIQSLKTTPALSINQLSNKIIDELLLEKNKGYSRTNLLFILRSLPNLKEADIQTVIQNVLKSSLEAAIKREYDDLKPSEIINKITSFVIDKSLLNFFFLDSSSSTKPTIQQSQINNNNNDNNNNQQQMSKSTANIPVPSLKNTLQQAPPQTKQQEKKGEPNLNIGQNKQDSLKERIMDQLEKIDLLTPKIIGKIIHENDIKEIIPVDIDQLIEILKEVVVLYNRKTDKVFSNQMIEEIFEEMNNQRKVLILTNTPNYTFFNPEQIQKAIQQIPDSLRKPAATKKKIQPMLINPFDFEKIQKENEAERIKAKQQELLRRYRPEITTTSNPNVKNYMTFKEAYKDFEEHLKKSQQKIQSKKNLSREEINESINQIKIEDFEIIEKFIQSPGDLVNLMKKLKEDNILTYNQKEILTKEDIFPINGDAIILFATRFTKARLNRVLDNVDFENRDELKRELLFLDKKKIKSYLVELKQELVNDIENDDINVLIKEINKIIEEMIDDANKFKEKLEAVKRSDKSIEEKILKEKMEKFEKSNEQTKYMTEEEKKVLNAKIEARQNEYKRKKALEFLQKRFEKSPGDFETAKTLPFHKLLRVEEEERELELKELQSAPEEKGTDVYDDDEDDEGKEEEDDDDEEEEDEEEEVS